MFLGSLLIAPHNLENFEYFVATVRIFFAVVMQYNPACCSMLQGIECSYQYCVLSCIGTGLRICVAVCCSMLQCGDLEAAEYLVSTITACCRSAV